MFICIFMCEYVNLHLLHLSAHALQNALGSSLVMMLTYCRCPWIVSMVNITSLVKIVSCKAALVQKKQRLFILPNFSKRVRELLFDAVPSSASSFHVRSLSALRILL